MGPTQRFDGKLPRSAWPASARRACPGPCSRLFDVHDRPRQATALTVGSTSASTCTHGRLRLLGRSNPPPVPISPSPIQSSPQHHPPETLFLDNTPPPARTTTTGRLPPNPLPVAVSLSVVGSEPIVAPQTDLSRDIRTPAGAPQTFGPSIITPARPRLLTSHPPPNLHRRLLRHRLAGIHLLCIDSTRRLCSSDPIVHSCSPGQSIACPQRHSASDAALCILL
jgi:hypothetical protein